MPRSGYVLYTNALWYDVKRRFGLAHADATHHHFNHLFHPYRRDMPEYHRARLLRHYVRARSARLRAVLEFREPRRRGLRGRCVRQCARRAGWAGRRRDGQAHHRHAAQGARLGAVPDPRGAASDVAPAPAVAAVHGTPPAEPSASVPQRRHLALRRRLLGHGAGAARPCRVGLAGAAHAWRARTSATAGASPSGSTAARWRAQGMAGQSWNAATFLFARRALRGDGDLFAPFA